MNIYMEEGKGNKSHPNSCRGDGMKAAVTSVFFFNVEFDFVEYI